MKFRTLVVDDMAAYRKILSEVVGQFPELEMAGSAANGVEALEMIAAGKVDLVLLDVVMPKLDGLATLKRVNESYPDIQVIMVSASPSDASAIVSALRMGALDFIRKPAGKDLHEATESLKRGLGKIVSTLNAKIASPRARRTVPAQKPSRQKYETIKPIQFVKPTFDNAAILAVTSSTGGPEALAKFIPKLPADFPLPVVVVQHMPPLFTKFLADSLDRNSALKVSEARQGDVVKKGHVLIAPGGVHMTLFQNGVGVQTHIKDGPVENGVKPAADVLFRSIAKVYPYSGVISVVLTGMGGDGAKGVAAMKKNMCFCLTQSEDSSVVYGMPKVVDEMGLADMSVDITQMADAVTRVIAGLKTV